MNNLLFQNVNKLCFAFHPKQLSESFRVVYPYTDRLAETLDYFRKGHVGLQRYLKVNLFLIRVRRGWGFPGGSIIHWERVRGEKIFANPLGRPARTRKIGQKQVRLEKKEKCLLKCFEWHGVHTIPVQFVFWQIVTITILRDSLSSNSINSARPRFIKFRFSLCDIQTIFSWSLIRYAMQLGLPMQTGILADYIFCSRQKMKEKTGLQPCCIPYILSVTEKLSLR